MEVQYHRVILFQRYAEYALAGFAALPPAMPSMVMTKWVRPVPLSPVLSQQQWWDTKDYGYVYDTDRYIEWICLI